MTVHNPRMNAASLGIPDAESTLDERSTVEKNSHVYGLNNDIECKSLLDEIRRSWNP